MKNKKAEMGIGTLIIFIALILVAAVAAGVLIQTSSSLQSQALMTGKKSQEQVGTNLNALEVSATNGSDKTLEHFYQQVKLAPGSDEISLSNVVLSFQTDDRVAYLKYDDSACQHDANGSTSGVEGFFTNASDVGYFTVEYLLGGDTAGYVTSDDIVKVCYEAPGSIGGGEDVKVSIIPETGSPLALDMVTPQVMTDYREQIYP